MHDTPPPRGRLRNQLRERRQALRISQRQLAERAGVNRATICSLERNGSHDTDSRVMVALCLALNVALDELFAIEGAA